MQTHDFTCPVCGAEVKDALPHKKYCSEACQVKAARERYKATGKRRQYYKKFKPEKRVCLTCGKEYMATRRESQYCSLECQRNVGKALSKEERDRIVAALRRMS